MHEPWSMHYSSIRQRYGSDAYRNAGGAVDDGHLVGLPLGHRESLHHQPDGKHLGDGGFQLAFSFVEQAVQGSLVFFRLLLFLDDNLFRRRRADAFPR